MLVTEAMLNPTLREIDTLYINGLPLDDADDLSKSVNWILDKQLNESNVSFVVNSLRGFKTVMDTDKVNRIIKNFVSQMGIYL